MDIDSNPPSGNTTPEIPRSAQVGQLPEKPSEEVKTLAEAEIEVSVLRLSVDYEDDDVPKKPTGKPQKRMLPAAPVAAEAVVRCVCWVLAQRLVRRRLEKAVGASQRWLFANVCSRRTRLALIGVASMLWGTLVSTVSICALFVIIAGNLEPVVDEAAQLGEWSVAVATTAAATFLALHVAHVLFGAFLIAASKVTGYRAPEGNTKLMEKLLLAVFKLMKIELTAPPPTACQHDPRSPSSPPSNSFSPHGFVSSDDEIGKDDRDRSPRPSGSKQEPCRPSHAEAPPTLPTHFSHGHIGWVRPGEGGNGNEGRKWPELPGNWRAPDFSTTVSNLPYPTPCNSNASSTSLTEPGHPPYPVPNHLPYPESNFHPNIPRDLPYPGPSVVPYSVPPSSSGVGQSMGFQTPPGGFNQTSSVEVANYSLKVRILKCQTPGGRGSPVAAAGEEDGEEWAGPSPVPRLLLPWLCAAWVTLGAYALIATGLAAVGRGEAAASVGALQLPAAACVVDVFAELRGVPESCGCKEVRSSSKGKKDKNEEKVKSRCMSSPPRRNSEPVYDETSPLLH
ncbi:Protein of unknown function [Gryllus bimaculatus]|nr:Protein of unknown function [Gryllus bimaculatus]